MRTIATDGLGEGNAISGELLGGSGKAPATFGSGRVCAEPGCSTRLSVYNSHDRCSVHDFDASLMNFRCATPSARPTGRTATPASITQVRAARRTGKRPAARVAKRHAA